MGWGEMILQAGGLMRGRLLGEGVGIEALGSLLTVLVSLFGFSGVAGVSVEGDVVLYLLLFSSSSCIASS